MNAKDLAEENENKYCSAFDYMYNDVSKKFAELFIKTCMTSAIIKRTLIVPPESVIKKIVQIKDKAKLITELQKYVLKTNFTLEAIKEKINGKIETIFFKKYFYNVEKGDKNDSVTFNGVEIKLVKKFNRTRTSLLKCSKALVPIHIISEEKKSEPMEPMDPVNPMKGKGKKMKKITKKSALPIKCCNAPKIKSKKSLKNTERYIKKIFI
jgi:hypothetical protein